MNLNLSYYNNSETGGLISKVISDAAIILHGFKVMADIVREPITVTLAMSYALWLDWKLTLIVLTAGPIIVFVLNRIAKSVRKYSHIQQESMEDLTSRLKETVDGIRIIQSFNLQEEMKSRLAKVVDRYLKTRKTVISRQESAGPFSEWLVSMSLGAVILYAGTNIMNETYTLGTFMGFLGAIAIMQSPIKKLQDGFVRIQQPIASIDRLFSILESGDTVKESPNAVDFPEDWDAIEFKNVSFSYGNEMVLKKVDLTIKRGEIVALVGESGSGKSTLVNMLERFFDPAEGEILIGGVNIQDIKLKELRHNVALVSQDVFLFNDSIKKNIQSGDFTRTDGDHEESAKLANAHNFISQDPEGYDALAGDRGAKLSGGEKQRVSIARAIYKNAPILILDEATSALDSVSEQEVQKGLDQLMQGRTAFVIAHRLSTVASASRIIVMKKGKVMEIGNHDELMQSQGEYFRFHKLQTLT